MESEAENAHFQPSVWGILTTKHSRRFANDVALALREKILAGMDSKRSMRTHFAAVSVWQSSISSMLSGSEARNTDHSVTAHVRTFHCNFAERNMDFEDILEEILLGREQGNLKLKLKQKVALQAISLNC